jgi:transposase
MSISEPKHMPEAAPVWRIEVFTGAGRRRGWSAREKAAIVAASYGTSETVCGVARRHGLRPQQLFTWRRLARRSGMAPPAMVVPAVLETAVPEPSASSQARRRARRRPRPDGIELEIAGVEVRVGAEAKPRAIAAVLRALKSNT